MTVQDFAEYAERIAKTLETAPSSELYMIRHSNGQFVMLGKNKGRFSTVAGAKKSLAGRVKFTLYWCAHHDVQDGKCPSNIDPRQFANDHCQEVRDEMLRQGILEIVQVQ